MASEVEGGAHDELERAGFILGSTREIRRGRISLLWQTIEADPYYRAPGHKPPSMPDPRLLVLEAIPERQPELIRKDTAGRHILYLDTIKRAFRAASIQVRLEKKAKRKNGELCEEFYEVTVKVGDKAKSRLEDKFRIDVDVLEREGFYEALKQAMQKELEMLEVRLEKEGKKSAIIKEKVAKRRTEHTDLKRRMKLGLGDGDEDEGKRIIKEAKVRSLIHLTRQTRETKYSPADDAEAAFELKTDDCRWLTVFSQKGEYGQVEVEYIAGSDVGRVDSELDRLVGNGSFSYRGDPWIEKTDASKPDPAYDALDELLDPYITPIDDSEGEAVRVAENERILEKALPVVPFKPISISSIKGLRLAPA